MSNSGALIPAQAPDPAEKGGGKWGPQRLRLGTARDVRRELVRLYAAAKAGQIPSQHATRLCYLLTSILAAISETEFEDRLGEIERKLNERS